MDEKRNGKTDKAMTQMENTDSEKCLRDLFSEENEPRLSSNFETNLMKKIASYEAKRVKKRQLLNVIIGVLSALVSLIAIIMVFTVFGWYKPFENLLSDFSSLQFNYLTIIPFVSISILLIADLFIRKYLSKS